MKLLHTLAFCFAALAAHAQNIQLPTPQLSEPSTSVVNALRDRHFVRSFQDRELSTQQLSNLCWAACGITRGTFRTAPTARNKQEIRLLVFTKEGVYEYEPQSNTLLLQAKGDHRMLLASNGPAPAGGGAAFRQDFVPEAPVTLVMVIDFDRFGSTDQRAMQMACVDAGNVSQNINLYCQSVGLATVPRATMDIAGIRQLLDYSEQMLPIMNNPVGYEKK